MSDENDDKLPGKSPEEADDSPAERELRESRVAEDISEEDSDDDEAQHATYETNIVSLEQQVGSHVVRALSHDGAAGVLTVAQPGPTGQRLVSIPLDGHMFNAIRQMIAANHAPQTPREVPCFGFHCRYEIPSDVQDDDDQKSSADDGHDDNDNRQDA